jgi:hypothetical protein
MSNQVQRVSTGYTPRPLQLEIHHAPQRFKVLNLHRRFGKTVLVINEQSKFLLQCKHKNPHAVYVAPTYGQAKRVAWEYYKEFMGMIPSVEFKEGELKVVIKRPAPFNDTLSIWLIGAENPDSIRGMYLDHVILDEYADMNPDIWDLVIRPAIADRRGHAIFIGTPKGQNHFFDTYQKALTLDSWYARTITVHESGYVDQDELDDAMLTMTEDQFNQEFLCSFTAALTGAYFAKYMQELEDKKRITSVPYDPSVPVDTFWDLGISDTTAIWFVQQVGQEIHVIDYLCKAGVGLEWYVKELKDKGYVYGEHTLPHDAAARELGTGKTRQETLRNFGLGRTTIQPRQSVADGINAARMLLPRCWFDRKKCSGQNTQEDGLKALQNYQRKYDNKNKAFLDKPLHDWASNGADAFRYLALGFRSNSDKMKFSTLPRTAVSEYNEYDEF